MEVVFMVQVKELGDEILWNAKATDSIPAPNEFDIYTVGHLILLAFPMRILDGTLISIPDTSKPLAGFRLLQNAELADHSGETATGEAATGETKEEKLITNSVVIDKEVIGGKDMFVDAVADGTWVVVEYCGVSERRKRKELLLPPTSEDASDRRCRT